MNIKERFLSMIRGEQSLVETFWVWFIGGYVFWSVFISVAVGPVLANVTPIVGMYLVLVLTVYVAYTAATATGVVRHCLKNYSDNKWCYPAGIYAVLFAFYQLAKILAA